MTRALVCGLALAVLARSTAAAAPEPILTLTIDPPRVVVGQRATLVATVLVPNYMPTPPVLPDFQMLNAVTRPLGAVNVVDQRDGVTYAGVRYEFAIFPQEPGSYAIADQKATVTYAADPPQTRTATIDLPRLSLEAFIPAPAQDLEPFVATSGLTIAQTEERSSDDLKVGDSLVRTVTIKADGIPAMLLPPTKFSNVDGLALYPRQPSLQDSLDRSGTLASTRVDEATYMLEKPGNYVLPAIELDWWNVRDKKVERTQTDAIAIHVADNPALAHGNMVSSRERWHPHTLFDWIIDHWIVAACILFALGAAAWALPKATRAIRQRIALRRSAYLNSEEWSFAQFRAAGGTRDPAKVYFALLNWLERFDPIAPEHNLDSLRRAARDPALDGQIASIDARLFGSPGGQTQAWSPRQLIKRVAIARRRLRRPAFGPSTGILPDDINPKAAAQMRFHRRPVAR